jgi:hypothetical protein
MYEGVVMNEQSEYSKKELKEGQFPHQLFLFNMVGNHVLLALIAVSNSSHLEVTVIPVFISLMILAYTLIRAPARLRSESLFVRSHWQIALKRTKIFLIVYAVLFTAGMAAWLSYSYGGVMKEQAMALVGGLGILPTMVMVLVLTILETETLHHAMNARIPKTLAERLGGG